MAEEIKKKLQNEMNKLEYVQKEYNEALSRRDVLKYELMKDLKVLKDLAGEREYNYVFKIVGSELVEHDLEDAKRIMIKSVDDLTDKLKDVQDLISALDEKMNTYKDALEKIGKMFDQIQIKN